MSQNIPNDLKYLQSHEWVRVEDGIATIGITEHAQDTLGEIVFVEAPDLDVEISTGDECAVVESVKAASDIYSPVSGEIVAINEALEDSPSLVNEHPYHDGWLFKVKMSDASELEGLLSAEAYAELL